MAERSRSPLRKFRRDELTVRYLSGAQWLSTIGYLSNGYLPKGELPLSSRDKWPCSRDLASVDGDYAQGAAPAHRLPSDADCAFLRRGSFLWSEGEELEGMIVRVFDPAKSVADCFRFRNKIGLDVAREALRNCYRQKKAAMGDLFMAARVCRVARTMQPYLESLT